MTPSGPPTRTPPVGNSTTSSGATALPSPPFTIHDNQLILTVHAGSEAGAPPTVTFAPDTGYYQVQDVDASTVAAGAPTQVDIERVPGSHRLHIVGTIAVGKSDREEIAIDDPAEFAALAFKQALVAQRITIGHGNAVAHHRFVSVSNDFVQESQTPLPALRARPVPGQPSSFMGGSVSPAHHARVCVPSRATTSARPWPTTSSSS